MQAKTIQLFAILAKSFPCGFRHPERHRSICSSAPVAGSVESSVLDCTWDISGIISIIQHSSERFVRIPFM
jgi:hypothetical protein